MKRLSEQTNRIAALVLVAVLLVSALAAPLTYHVRIVEADTTTQEVFSTVGSGTWTVPQGVETVQVLVVAGGGGGGGAGVAYYEAGGGGAGGLVYNASYPVTAGANISYTVGDGGAGGSGGDARGDNGANSTFGTLTATGGGGGGNAGSTLGYRDGRNGGCGGGAGAQSLGGDGSGGTGSQGYNGGTSNYECCWIIICTCYGRIAGGGGGGNSAVGANAASNQGGNGGAGTDYSSIFGTGVGASGRFAGGGGGGAYSGTAGTGGTGGGGNGGINANGGAGTSNTGGGGGGAGCTGTVRTGGKGGSGVVIIKYTKFERNLTTSASTGGTVSTPGIGTYTYGKNQVVSIVATNNSCYAFVNWSGNGSGAVANVSAASTTITMSNHYAIQANFKWNCWYLTTSSTDGGNVTTPGESTYGPYTDGQVVSIAATADTYWAFVNWTGSGVTAGKVANASAASTTITMNGNYSVTANFRYNAYNLITTSGDGGNVTTPGEGTYVYTNGSSATIVATADTCHAFVNWTGDTATIANVNASSTTITMNGNKSIQANFRWNCYTLTTTSGADGDVTTPGESTYTYAYAQVVSIAATPDYCHAFDYWSGNTGTIANTSAASTTITMYDNYSVQANFKWGSCYNLTITTSSGGTVTSPGVGIYPYPFGSVVNLTASQSACYSFDSWTGNVSTIPDIIDPTTNITLNDNYEIQSNFARNTTILTLTSANTSRGNPYFAGSNPIECGEITSIYANTSPGYVFVGWTPSNGVSDSTKANTSVLMTENRNIVAYYDPMGTPVPVTPVPTATYVADGTGTRFLTWHIAPGDFNLSTAANQYIIATMTATTNTSRGKLVQKQLTIYIKQRPVSVGLGRGGIWGESAIVGLESMTIHGQTNLLNGDVYVDGYVTVDGKGNMVSGTLYCTPPVNAVGPGADFAYTYGGACPEMTFPDLGVPQDKFGTVNLTVGGLEPDVAEFAWTTAVILNNVDEVWEDDDPDTNQLRDGYYYSNVSITLNGNRDPIRGQVTFIAPQITINNQTNGGWSEDYYIGLDPWDHDDLLMWSTGSGGSPSTLNDGQILIKGSSGWWNPCARFRGVLFAPNGEIELQGSGSTLPSYSKATITGGAILAKDLSFTSTGSDWWIYRW